MALEGGGCAVDGRTFQEERRGFAHFLFGWAKQRRGRWPEDAPRSRDCRSPRGAPPVGDSRTDCDGGRESPASTGSAEDGSMSHGAPGEEDAKSPAGCAGCLCACLSPHTNSGRGHTYNLLPSGPRDPLEGGSSEVAGHSGGASAVEMAAGDEGVGEAEGGYDSECDAGGDGSKAVEGSAAQGVVIEPFEGDRGCGYMATSTGASSGEDGEECNGGSSEEEGKEEEVGAGEGGDDGGREGGDQTHRIAEMLEASGRSFSRRSRKARRGAAFSNFGLGMLRTRRGRAGGAAGGEDAARDKTNEGAGIEPANDDGAQGSGNDLDATPPFAAEGDGADADLGGPGHGQVAEPSQGDVPAASSAGSAAGSELPPKWQRKRGIRKSPSLPILERLRLRKAKVEDVGGDSDALGESPTGAVAARHPSGSSVPQQDSDREASPNSRPEKRKLVNCFGWGQQENDGEEVVTRAVDLERQYVDCGAPPGVVGLVNLGNSCFLNAALQCIRSTPGLAVHLVPELKDLALAKEAQPGQEASPGSPKGPSDSPPRPMSVPPALDLHKTSPTLVVPDLCRTFSLPVSLPCDVGGLLAGEFGLVGGSAARCSGLVRSLHRPKRKAGSTSLSALDLELLDLKGVSDWFSGPFGSASRARGCEDAQPAAQGSLADDTGVARPLADTPDITETAFSSRRSVTDGAPGEAAGPTDSTTGDVCAAVPQSCGKPPLMKRVDASLPMAKTADLENSTKIGVGGITKEVAEEEAELAADSGVPCEMVQGSEGNHELRGVAEPADNDGGKQPPSVVTSQQGVVSHPENASNGCAQLEDGAPPLIDLGGVDEPSKKPLSADPCAAIGDADASKAPQASSEDGAKAVANGTEGSPQSTQDAAGVTLPMKSGTASTAGEIEPDNIAEGQETKADSPATEGDSAPKERKKPNVAPDFLGVFKKAVLSLCSGAHMSSFNPEALYQQLELLPQAEHLCDGGQQDCLELVKVFLCALHENLNSAKPSEPAQYGEDKQDEEPDTENAEDKKKTAEKVESENQKADQLWNKYLSQDCSIVTDMFAGQLQCVRTCHKCNSRTTTYETFWELSLPLAKEDRFLSFWFNGGRLPTCLEDLLKAFTAGEEMRGDCAPNCEKCGQKQNATRRLRIHRFPPVLVLNIKRFKYTKEGREKLSTNINFPVRGLQLQNYTSKESGMRNSTITYDLCSVSNHFGSLCGGHYTAFCRLRNQQGTDAWFCLNDEHISTVSEEAVVTPNAYVLFYVRQPFGGSVTKNGASKSASAKTASAKNG